MAGIGVNFFLSQALLPSFKPSRPNFSSQIRIRLQRRERKGLRERILHVKATAQAQDGLARIQSMMGGKHSASSRLLLSLVQNHHLYHSASRRTLSLQPGYRAIPRICTCCSGRGRRLCGRARPSQRHKHLLNPHLSNRCHFLGTIPAGLHAPSGSRNHTSFAAIPCCQEAL